MSLNYTQILSQIDRYCHSNSVSYETADKLTDINLALDYAYSVIFSAGGKWQFDDSNHIDYPIITTNLVAGQRDYSFTSDEQGNLILDIYKVAVAQPDGTFKDIYPVDMQSDSDVSTFYDGNETQGVPTRYDKTGNGVFLDLVPSYNSTNGLKIFINREGSYFKSSDTTKKAGFAGLFHEFLVLRPSYIYASINGLSNVNKLEGMLLKMEDDMKKYYGMREKDVKKTIRPRVESNK